MDQSPDEFDGMGMLLIVTGAHLRAEIADRPLAYELADHATEWFQSRDVAHISAVVCSDVWYVNHKELHTHPTISIGGPGVNALSAYLHQRLETVYVVEDRAIVQLDPEFIDLRASVWGVNHALTVEALTVLRDRYLEPFLQAVATQVLPETE